MYLMPDPKMEYIVIFCSTVSTEPAAWWEVFLVSPSAEAHLGTRRSLNGPSLGHEAWFANPFEKKYPSLFASYMLTHPIQYHLCPMRGISAVHVFLVQEAVVDHCPCAAGPSCVQNLRTTDHMFSSKRTPTQSYSLCRADPGGASSGQGRPELQPLLGVSYCVEGSTGKRRMRSEELQEEEAANTEEVAVVGTTLRD
ncbi:hypothetical protein E2C01_026629 [Portunus trituberculatus]|uniref:Uncharacterized protein n=1 Tax=Portunus trituberculatus TaxID=210409 RepID=A0A5B7EIP2_PORTR|nr:hypothetical protein [Portunus trituberculatus]